MSSFRHKVGELKYYYYLAGFYVEIHLSGCKEGF